MKNPGCTTGSWRQNKNMRTPLCLLCNDDYHETKNSYLEFSIFKIYDTIK